MTAYEYLMPGSDQAQIEASALQAFAQDMGPDGFGIWSGLQTAIETQRRVIDEFQYKIDLGAQKLAVLHGISLDEARAEVWEWPIESLNAYVKEGEMNG